MRINVGCDEIHPMGIESGVKYAVFNIYGDHHQFECITDDFWEWLKKHNQVRWKGMACGSWKVIDEANVLHYNLDEHNQKKCNCIESVNKFACCEVKA